jgi:dolichyl-phosphate beta-glucosyltransferase
MENVDMDRGAETELVELSVVIPCYNERGRLPASLERVLEFLDGSGRSFEIVVVDDGSADGTLEYATEVAAGDPRVRALGYDGNRGKGFAVAYGVVRTRGRSVLVSDADLSTPIEQVDRFLPLLEDAEIVIGSRAIAGADLRVRQPWWRERVGRLMNTAIRTISGLNFADTQCGFKLFTRRAAQDIFSQVTVERWMFDVEALLIGRKLGYRITETPVTWIHSGESRVKLSHLFSVLRELVHIRFYWLRAPRRQWEADEAVSQAIS